MIKNNKFFIVLLGIILCVGNVKALEITQIERSIIHGLTVKLASPPERDQEKISQHELREYFLAFHMQNFIHDVPEFAHVVAVFFSEGGFQENGEFSFDKLFAAIDHGAIRARGDFTGNIPEAFAPFGLTTPNPEIPEYQFIPTGKPIDANAYGPYDAYGHHDLNQFRAFVSRLRLDLLPEDIKKRADKYIDLSFNTFDNRIALLAKKEILTRAEGRLYAYLVVNYLLARKKNSPDLKKDDPELYFILKKTVPEIFNALMFGPQLNHLAIDLRKTGVAHWESIDRFFDDIGKPGQHGRAHDNNFRWGFDTLDSVQGDPNDEQVKIRQTSIKMHPEKDRDACCYIEFVVRSPLTAGQNNIYEGFHTYNATNIYTSNRSGDEFIQDIKQYDDNLLRDEIATNIQKAKLEYRYTHDA